MKKVICKKTYDTETATLIKAYSFSQLGDPPVTRKTCTRRPRACTSCT